VNVNAYNQKDYLAKKQAGGSNTAQQNMRPARQGQSLQEKIDARHRERELQSHQSIAIDKQE